MYISGTYSLKFFSTTFLAMCLCSSIFATFYLYKVQLYNFIGKNMHETCDDCEHRGKENQMAFENLELYLRMTSKFAKQYNELLLPSLRYFWPGNVSLVVVLDEENAMDKELGKTLSGRYPYPRVEYQSHPGIYHRKGHERMQRDFFYPEDKIKKRYVGFLDTDTVFITRVTPEILFEEGKPMILGTYGKSDEKYFKMESLTTASLYKSKEVMRTMSYFPVIIKVSHIVELRKYMEKLHNKSFDEIYRQYSGGTLSQFSIITQYMWTFHRDKYKFYFHLKSYNNGICHGEGNSPNRQPYEFYQINVTEDQKMPRPKAAVHYRYHLNWKKPPTLKNVLKTGICFSGGFDICPNLCKHLNESALHRELFYFENVDLAWDKRCLDEQKRHYARVSERRNTNADSAIKAGCTEVDKLWFEA